MKKRCIICGKEVEVKVGANTKIFLINMDPCICSDCVIEMFEIFCDKQEGLDEYKVCVEKVLKTILVTYPDKWDEEIESHVIAELKKGTDSIGQFTNDDAAKRMIDRVKAEIDKNPNKYREQIKKLKNEKGESKTSTAQRTSDSVSVMAICDTEVDESTNERKIFRNIIPVVKDIIRGQDDAVNKIGRVFFHNQQCVSYNKNNPLSPRIRKQNMVLVGPTGTGKTATVTEYCRLLKLPYVIADMTAYTQAGYAGCDIEDIFRRLIKEADGDVSLAQRGIIIMDEGDKNEAKVSSNEIDVGGKGVIDSLLKKIEGSVIELGKGQTFDSTNTTFVAMGVYPKLYDIRKERLTGKRSIGFGTSETVSSGSKEFIADDFVKHGFSQEYIGRFSTIVELSALTDEAYLDILRNSRSSAYRQYKSLFEYSYGVDLIITPEGEQSIIDKAKKYNTGARGLHRCLSEILEGIETRFMLEDFSCEKVVIDKDCEVKIM